MATNPFDLTPDPMAPSIGEIGETLVANWLQTQNYTILRRNWISRLGEIDLIAATPNETIALVEVKTRGIKNWDIDGRLAITPDKQRKLWQTAELFISKHPQWADRPYRFDVALVGHSPSQPRNSALYHQVHDGRHFSLHTYIDHAFSG